MTSTDVLLSREREGIPRNIESDAFSGALITINRDKSIIESTLEESGQELPELNGADFASAVFETGEADVAAVLVELAGGEPRISIARVAVPSCDKSEADEILTDYCQFIRGENRVYWLQAERSAQQALHQLYESHGQGQNTPSITLAIYQSEQDFSSVKHRYGRRVSRESLNLHNKILARYTRRSKIPTRIVYLESGEYAEWLRSEGLDDSPSNESRYIGEIADARRVQYFT